ncbi:MAG: CubicO group peptidase (beta-lactamase class C family) [Psychroserpens sp.]|jgi:CubicO group peptidase (beta-lactamase class C family)
MKIQYLLFILLFISCSGDDSPIDIPIETNEAIYFPPNGTDEWETVSLSELNWNESNLQPLLDFVEEKNSKSFIVLHNGKIVVEEYMNGHSDTNIWYWASAGKTLTAAASGIAQDNGILNLNNKVSDYLGAGWTSVSLDKENLITCKNLLSMNSGLDDTLGGDVSPANLQYLSDSGTRWAYHNVYVKMQDVLAEASNETWSNYFNTNLRDKIGMSGSWLNLNDLSVYWSNTRSMARFGLMTYAKGFWENTQIVSEIFINEATNTSQNINEAYGYLWWLNGKSTYHLPQSQFEFSGKLIPNAPDDMYAALGKNDQKIYVVPSKKLVIIRMGNAADTDDFALSTFDNELWEKINQVIN